MKWMTLALLMVAGTASAQTLVTPRSVEAAFGPPMRVEPALSPFAFGFGRTLSDTPTTLRQREARAALVFARYPELRQRLANNPGWMANAAYAAAERKVRWELIRAREGAR